MDAEPEAQQPNPRRNAVAENGTGTVQTAIDLSGLGLDTIEETEEGFSIGAMVTLRQLEQHPGLNRYTQNAVQKAVKDIVGVQFRNLATLGGSLWGRFGVPCHGLPGGALQGRSGSS